MFKDIYKKGPIRYPKELHKDNGTEFKADVQNLMEAKDVKVVSVTTKYHHNFTAFVERFNKTLAERLFKPQDAQELQNPTKDSKSWVKYLQKTLQKLNSEKTRMLEMAPAKAVKLGNVELKIKPYQKENDVASEDGSYRYLYRPGELEGGDRRCATDKIWSWDTFRLDRIDKNPGQRVLYYLAEGPKKIRKSLSRKERVSLAPLQRQNDHDAFVDLEAASQVPCKHFRSVDGVTSQVGPEKYKKDERFTI